MNAPLADTQKIIDDTKKSEAVLQRMFTAQPITVGNATAPVLLTGAPVTIAKGYSVDSERPEIGHDQLEISLQTEAARSSEAADAIGKMMLKEMNTLPALRKHAILTTEKEYLAQVQGDTRGLLKEAKDAGIEGCKIDLAEAKIYDPSYSINQIGDYGVDLIEGPAETTIRVQIPTNPKKPDEAMNKAKEIETKIKAKLPAMQAAAIKRAKDRNYIPGMTAEIEKQLAAHTFETSIQQQQTEWTSVFIHIRSPKQQQHKEKPAEKVDLDELGKTNLFSMIPEQKNRFKLASRLVLFEGEKLKEPADFFLDVAGTQDMKSALGKVMARLKEKKPELTDKIDTLLAEDVFHKRRQWNLPRGEQEEWKGHGYAYVSTRDPNMVKVSINLPKGKAEEILDQLAKMEAVPAQTAPAQQPAAPVLQPVPTLQIAPAPAETPALPLADGAVAKIGPAGIEQILAKGPAGVAPLLAKGQAATQAELVKKSQETSTGRVAG